MDDRVVVEEPMEIRLGYGPLDDRKETPLAVTMRTPGNDRELGVGFLLTEGVVAQADDIAWVTHCSNALGPDGEQNVLRVELDEEIDVDLDRLSRHFYTASSCGVCGKSSIDAIKQAIPRIAATGIELPAERYLLLPEKLRAAQKNFASTGGIHAAASFDTNGDIVTCFEDVGRHNALDKLIGHHALQGDLPLQNNGMIVSGRLSFELVQKAAAAGCGLLVAIGAPSSLAIATADELGVRLIGFLSEEGFNRYGKAQQQVCINTTTGEQISHE